MFLLVQLEKSIPVLSLQKVLVHNLSKNMFIGGSVVHSTNNSYLIKKLKALINKILNAHDKLSQIAFHLKYSLHNEIR